MSKHGDAIIRLTAALAEKDVELARWKSIAQRNNPSGCCCRIDDNNGDPKMIQPCVFHAEWRDKALAELREGDVHLPADGVFDPVCRVCGDILTTEELICYNCGRR